MRTLKSIATTLLSVWCLSQSFVAAAQTPEMTVVFQPLGEAFFTFPESTADAWKDLVPVAIPLFPQNITTPSLKESTVSTVTVKAVHNGTWLAVLLMWSDPTANVHVETDQASDACAVQFPLQEVEKTSPFMGGKDFPVAILHWKAIWQQDVGTGYQQVTDLYPHTWVDTYRFGQKTATLANNPIAHEKRTSPVEELIAEGFGTLTTQRQQNARAASTWKDGTWSVVFSRKLNTRDSQDPILTPGEKTSLAFAVWDGSRDNVGARKNYAPWVATTLEKKP